MIDFNSIDPAALMLRGKQMLTISRLISVLNGLLALFILWQTAQLGARLLEHEVMQVPFIPQSYKMPETTKDRFRSYQDFQAIITHNIFNAEVSEEMVTMESEPEIVSSESLKRLLKNWQLLGIYTGSVDYCFIQDQKSRQEEMFGVGDRLFQTAVRVSKIEATGDAARVYVERNGEMAVLEYRETAEQKQISRQAGQTVPGAKPNKYTTNGKDFHISSAEVDHHLNNFSRLLNQARVVPYFQGGKNIGYKIKAIDKGSLYEKLGLVNNDIIQRINGQSIDSPEKAFQLLKLLRNEREISVSILRKQKAMNLTYFIE